MVIWLLEDEAAFAELALEKLRQNGDAAWRCMWLRCFADALARTAQETPDVLIADIQLEGESGIDAARALLERFPTLKVIFLTGNPGASHDIYDSVQPYAVRHKNYDPWKYIVSDLRKIAGELDSHTCRFQMAVNSKTIDLPLRDIAYIEHSKNDTYIHVPGAKECRLRVKIDDVMPLLDSRFVRCGKSFAANLDHVTGLGDDAFLLLDKQVPISRTYKTRAVEAFHAWKGGLARV